MKKLLIGIIIILALGGGFFVGLNYQDWSLSKDQKSLVNKYSNLDLSLCLNLGGDKKIEKLAQVGCYDNQLASFAIANVSAQACRDVTDSTIKQDCLGRVARLKKISGQEKAFCEGVSNDPFCVDLASFLVAQESNSIQACSSISNVDLQQVCLRQLQGGVAVADLPEPPEQVLNEELGLIVPQFGLICPEGDDVCEEIRPVFLSVVAGGEVELCNQTGIYFNLCQREAALRQSLLAGNTTACEEFSPKEFCEIDLTIAQALEVKDVGLCDSLQEVSSEACKNIVNAATERRFDYLLK